MRRPAKPFTAVRFRFGPPRIDEIKNDSNFHNAINKITTLMSNAHLPIITFSTPIKVSVGYGNNWDEAH